MCLSRRSRQSVVRAPARGVLVGTLCMWRVRCHTPHRRVRHPVQHELGTSLLAGVTPMNVLLQIRAKQCTGFRNCFQLAKCHTSVCAGLPRQLRIIKLIDRQRCTMGSARPIKLRLAILLFRPKLSSALPTPNCPKFCRLAPQAFRVLWVSHSGCHSQRHPPQHREADRHRR